MDAIVTLQHKRLLRVGEAARILNVSRWTVYRWVEAGRLGGTRLGVGSLRVFSHTVAALINLHYVGAAASAEVGQSEYSRGADQRGTGAQVISGDRRGLREFATV